VEAKLSVNVKICLILWGIKMKINRIYILLLIPVLAACHDPSSDEKKEIKFNKEAVKKQFEEANKLLAKKEADDMDAYARQHKMNFVNTDLGLRYYVYEPSAKGDSIRDNTQITMDFTVSLLDGTECYSSAQKGPKTFIVGKEDIESGIHMGVKFLKKGDKAVIMIPSHLAHGLLGDMDKIPPQMPIIYDIQIHN
jgi:FKBP-type peptidyl-prolyl cis-trans isomerase FkpA